MKNCIFCKIVKGEIPSYNVYEDEKTFAFLDVNPVSKGHTLIIPKKHYRNIYDIPENELNEIMKVVKKIINRYKNILKMDGVNIVQSNEKIAGQIIFHFHIHLIPRYKEDGIKLWTRANSKEEINLNEIYKIIKR